MKTIALVSAIAVAGVFLAIAFVISLFLRPLIDDDFVPSDAPVDEIDWEGVMC